MEGDMSKDGEEKQHDKKNDEVKITIFGKKKSSKSKDIQLKGIQAVHKLNVVNYNFRNKYKPQHDRDFVYYHRDFAAYNYRGYDIKEPKVKICPIIEDDKEVPIRWIQYMTHVERHPRKPPRMIYTPSDNSFVQIVLLSLLFVLLLTVSDSYFVMYSLDYRSSYLEPFDYTWISACLILAISIYSVACTACSRKFPCGFILLILTVAALTYMCSYTTVTHDTYGVILALFGVIFIVVFLILCSFCEVDFRRFKFLLFTGILAFLFEYILIQILIKYNENWLPYLPRRENLIIFGVVIYSMSIVLTLQLILSDRTLKLADDDYALGTFMLYLCVPFLFMKLVSYMGLYEENP